MAFKVQADQRLLNTYDPTKYCKHCSRQGHSDDGCFKIIGYPEWWGDRPKNGRGGRTGGRGRGRTGGGNANGRGGRGQGGNTVHAHNLHISVANQTSGASTSDGSGLVGVTAAQVQQVMEYLNSRKTSSHLQGPVDEEDDWSG
ncbi:uncharacterized protein LOC113353110 [Papaver somniferum]|uniref:uncharacterized protein LOC113353110 n=1 Tax=Papaver somniferum TaxID=3469 RepID=UPI000E6FBBA1|nr:uncharacterized protein LOC113353110 [Papaver somniferum]